MLLKFKQFLNPYLSALLECHQC